jgi:hypothetical protein
MTNRRLLMASAILASVAITACSDTMAPEQAAPGKASFARSGILRVTKECHDYHGQAHDLCTITSSNLKEIEVGSTVTYLSAASPSFFLDSDVILDPPGPGNNVAFGHCTVDLTNINGTTGCIFSGGTGKFKWFHADVKLSLLDPNDPATELVWNGTYSFSPRD